MSSQQQNTVNPENLVQAYWNPEEMFLKNRSWAQMIADEEEEEEEERKMLEQEKIKNIIACRQFLYSIGEYELEEGEILE